MRLLLDTHALIWAAAEPSRIPDRVGDRLRDPTVEVLVSTASAWEIAIKSGQGRLAFAPVTDELLHAHGWRHLQIGLRHTRAVTDLPQHHGDPFDRLLIAQAQVDGLTVVSIDETFDDYGTDRLW